MGCNRLCMMMVRRPTFCRIAQELQDNTLLDLELHPAVERDMRSNCYQHYNCDNDL